MQITGSWGYAYALVGMTMSSLQNWLKEEILSYSYGDLLHLGQMGIAYIYQRTNANPHALLRLAKQV